PAGGAFFDGKGPGDLDRGGFRAFQDVPAHRVGGGVVQDQDQVVEVHHLLKPARQVAEQRSQIPVGDDRFRNRQKRSVLPGAGRNQVVSCSVARHERHPDQPPPPNSRGTQTLGVQGPSLGTWLPPCLFYGSRPLTSASSESRAVSRR